MPAGPPLSGITPIVWALALTAAALTTVAWLAVIIRAIFLEPVVSLLAGLFSH